MPRYCLRKDLGFWRLRFRGREAVFKHEQGAGYVAYLLLNPPEGPIHALDLVVRVGGPDRKNSGIAELVDPVTGRVRLLEAGARLQERSLGLEDAQTMREVLRTENQLEALGASPMSRAKGSLGRYENAHGSAPVRRRTRSVHTYIVKADATNEQRPKK